MGRRDKRLEIFGNEFKMKNLGLSSKFIDALWIYNLLNDKIDCPETLALIPINVPKFSLCFTTSLYTPTYHGNHELKSPLNRLVVYCPCNEIK